MHRTTTGNLILLSKARKRNTEEKHKWIKVLIVLGKLHNNLCQTRTLSTLCSRMARVNQPALNQQALIRGWNIARKVGHRVVVKAFPGATTSDMEHHLKPALAKDPQRVIFHVGTNDLKTNLRPNHNQIADSIMNLARMTESESRADVIISEVITRSDKTPEDHIRTVNKLLSRCCNQNGWQLLRLNNISKDHLNDGGLHLNDQGVSVLVTNLTTFLSD